MSQLMIFGLLLMVFSPGGFAQDKPSITGDWDGSLKVPVGIEMRLTLHPSEHDATMDSPDQHDLEVRLLSAVREALRDTQIR